MNKIIFSFCCLYISIFSFGQNNRLALEVKTDDKPTIHGFSFWQEIDIKSKDTAFTYRLHTARPDVIKNLKPGKYTVGASSVFHHRVSKKVELTKKTLPVKFSLESFYTKAPENIMLSEKLKLNDTLYILYSATQDENAKEKLAVTKTKTGYTAIQYQGIGNEIFQTMMVKEVSYKSVIKFEAEGKKANSPKAETAPVAEVYTIELNKEITTFIVPGQFNGLTKLKAVLFIVEQK